MKLFLLIMVFIMGSCLDYDEESKTTDKNPGNGGGKISNLTYYQQIQPILDKNCSSCHRQNGGAPFDLTQYENVKKWSSAMASAVETGSMPPWNPDPNCRHYIGERVMPTKEKEQLISWLKGDKLMGEKPAASGQAKKSLSSDDGLGKAELTLFQSEEYTPKKNESDDYRCFVLDQKFEKDTFVKGIRFLPKNLNLVHHIIIYKVLEKSVNTVLNLDKKENGPGYSCYGGARAAGSSIIEGWAPGAVPYLLKDSKAYIIEKGSRLVMQVHYFIASDKVEPVKSGVDIFLLNEEPKALVQLRPMVNGAIFIKKNDKKSVHDWTYDFSDAGLKIMAVFPHMHMLGKKLKVTVTDPKGKETCLVDIPKWDFNWQQMYYFKSDEVYSVNKGDNLKLRCEYDNSSENQPIVNGKKVESRDVSWGDGSLDEMCLSYISVVEPYAGSNPCKSFDSCFKNCKKGPAACTLECAKASHDECFTCSADFLKKCGNKSCPSEVQKANKCIAACINKKQSIEECKNKHCQKEFNDLDSCLKPLLAKDSCQKEMAACKISVQ